MVQQAYLQTDYVVEGQFSNEHAVGLTDWLGEKTSAFFPVKAIKDGKLEVTILDEDKNRGLFLVRVPGVFLEGKMMAGEACYITIKKESISFEEKELQAA